MAMSKTAAAAVFLLISGARAERHSLNLETLEVEQAASLGPDEDCAKKCPGSHASKTSKVALGLFGKEPEECACDADMVLGSQRDGSKVSLQSNRSFVYKTTGWDFMCMFDEERPFRKARAEMQKAIHDVESHESRQSRGGESPRRGGYSVFLEFKALGEVGEALRYAAGALKKEEVKPTTVDTILEHFDCGSLDIQELTGPCQAAVAVIRSNAFDVADDSETRVRLAMHFVVANPRARRGPPPREMENVLRAMYGLESIATVPGLGGSEPADFSLGGITRADIQNAVSKLDEVTKTLRQDGGYSA